MQIFGFLGSILGYILWAAFYVLHNFGLAIIVFTIIVKLVLFPFSVKQQKSMAGTARLSKKQKELQEKYGNNRQLLQEEMNKLYEKEGREFPAFFAPSSPTARGLLPAGAYCSSFLSSSTTS